MIMNNTLMYKILKENKNSSIYCGIIISLMVCLNTSAAFGYTLDFSGLGIDLYDPIPEEYGDVENIVDVSYRQLVDFADSAETLELRYQDTGYYNLHHVAYGASNEPTNVGEISFTPEPGYNITLSELELGSWGLTNNDYDTQVIIYNSDYSSILWQTGEITVSGWAGINPGVTLDDTIHVQWQYPYMLAIDNVEYSAAVPIPGAFWLLGSSLIAFVGLRRK